MSEERDVFEWEPGKELDQKKAAAAKEKLQEIFNRLLEQYEPAGPNDATVRMTTKQIFNKVFAFFPSEFNPSVIYDLMKENKFEHEIAGSEMDFYWLLKEKP